MLFKVFIPGTPSVQITDPHTKSPHWSPYISLKNKLTEVDKRWKYFVFGDHFGHALLAFKGLILLSKKNVLIF